MRFIRIGLSCVFVFHGDADTTLLRDTDSRARQTSRAVSSRVTPSRAATVHALSLYSLHVLYRLSDSVALSLGRVVHM